MCKSVKSCFLKKRIKGRRVTLNQITFIVTSSQHVPCVWNSDTCRKQFTYIQYILTDLRQCAESTHILSTHSVLLDHLQYQYTYTHMYTSTHLYNTICESAADYKLCHGCALKPPDVLYLCSVCVVQLNCVTVKVQCMAYGKVGVCCRGIIPENSRYYIKLITDYCQTQNPSLQFILKHSLRL